jgi:hypothetical protein
VIYPEPYELAQTLNPTKGISSQDSSYSTRRQQLTLASNGRSVFNDSFEEGVYEEDRYTTREHLLTNSTSADSAKIPGTTTDQTTEENLYEFPEDVIMPNISTLDESDIYDDTLPNNEEENIYECPDDIIADTSAPEACKFPGEAAIGIPPELYECLDEVTVDRGTNEEVERGSLQRNEETPLDIYDSCQ